ncbi:ATP synthase F1 subunit epsilon [Candidatus Woesebacteria bacterium]|nr:ATP synthase F1 subunit epsilon [Candidatus Woesebacteria bacterium]
MLHLKVTTPRKLVKDMKIDSITVPSAAGEITILPQHEHLLSLLQEGIITIRSKNEEEYLAIGGGYIETDGKTINILVSRAYNQDEIDEETTRQAVEKAKQILEDKENKTDRGEANALLRRSLVDIKLLRKARKRSS